MNNAIPVLTGTMILAVAAALPARAQDPGGLARCRSITHDVERLGCYDGLADAARQAASADAGRGYQTLNLTDVKLDQDSCSGSH